MYIKKKYRKILALADKEFTIPKSFQKFINEKKKFHNLIIKSKGGNCYCTCCHNKFNAQVKVNCEIKCPNCKQRLLVKTDRLQSYIFKDNLQLLDKVNDIFILRTFELYTSYNKYKNKIENHITEFMRTIIDKDEVRDFVSNQVCNHMGYMYVAHYMPFTNWRARNYRWAYRDVLGMVSPYNLKALFKNTELKYSQLNKYVTKMDYIDFIRCMKLASYPSFEMLVKMKLYNLASDADKFTKGSNFQEIFGLNKKYYPFMKKQNINYSQLKVLKILQLEDIKLINNKHYEHEYLDYLRMNIQLGYSLKDKKILYPKNLIKEHDKLVDLIEMIEDEANDRLIKERLKELNKNIYQNKKYIIFPAPSVASMVNESKEQSNCLKTYCSRYALGETDIFFLRELEHKEKSLVTVEVRNNKVVQARIKYNEFPTKEQQKFLDKWQTKILSKQIV